VTFDLDLSFDNPEEEPVFMDTATMIAQLEQETYAYNENMQLIKAAAEEAMRKVQEKYSKDRLKLIMEQEERIKQLKALREQREREDAAKVFEKTAAIVKEIVNGFAAWQSAHEYQMEDIISSVHSYLQGEKGILNANDMGLGKTFETIVTLYILTALYEQEHGRKPTVLWLTKSSILETNSTNKEFDRWWPELKIASVSGSMNKEHREYMVELWLILVHGSLRTTKLLRQRMPSRIRRGISSSWMRFISLRAELTLVDLLRYGSPQ